MDFNNVAVKDFRDFVELTKKYKRELSLILGGVIVISCSIWGLYFYKISKSQNAHTALIECMKYYNASVETDKSSKQSNGITFRTAQDKWNKVEQVCKDAYSKYSSTGLAGIFLNFESVALLNQGKTKEAKIVLKEALDLIASSDLKQLYGIKYALMQMDNESEVERSLGLEQLEKYAADSKSIVNDQALYYLGEYYWTLRNFDQVKNYWNQLVHMYGQGTRNPSPWIGLAKNKLKLITSK